MLNNYLVKNTQNIDYITYLCYVYYTVVQYRNYVLFRQEG